MRNGLFGSVMAVATVVAIVSLAPPLPTAGQEGAVAQPTSLGGCPAETLAFHTCAREKAKTFVPPRTPGGKPDMQDIGTGN